MKTSGLIAAIALSLVAGLAAAAEFDGNCAVSLSEGRMFQTRCTIKTEYQGKEYCFSSEASKDTFLEKPEEIIMKAQAFYDKNKNAEPVREKITQEQALEQIKSPNCDLSNKDAGYLIFNKMDLHHCKMVNISFFGAELMGANLSGANLQGAYLNLARLEGADFSGANLVDAIIFQAIFSKTNFKGANLSNARVIGTLGNVDMSGATIKKGRFGLDVGNQPMGQMKFDSVGGNFAGADFEGSDLNIAAFTFGNLSGANLRGTNMNRADLNQANLTGADLTGADLTNAEVDGAIFKDVKGLDTVKGFGTVKGKCVGCK